MACCTYNSALVGHVVELGRVRVVARTVGRDIEPLQHVVVLHHDDVVHSFASDIGVCAHHHTGTIEYKLYTPFADT